MSNQQQARIGSIEGKLDGIGGSYLFLSIVAAIICLFLASDQKNQQPEAYGFWIGFAIGTLAQGIIFWILFKAVAEIIRLLKKLNGLPYGGVISQTQINEITTAEYTCTDCGATVNENANFCAKCGVKFDESTKE